MYDKTNRYVDLLMTLPYWPSINEDLSPSDWQEFYDTAALMQKIDAEFVESVLMEFTRRAQAIQFDVSMDVETKVFLLLRVMFDLPTDGLPEERRPFIGLLNWPKGRDRYDLSWPIRWQDGSPKLIARYKGRVGGLYDAAAEFDFFRSNFPYRDLSKLARVTSDGSRQ